MTLAQVPKGDILLIDANIFIYAALGKSRQCERLVERCAAGEVFATITSHILAEVTHRLMMAEARENGWIGRSNPARNLAEQPERIKTLSRYENSVKSLLAMGMRFEPVEKGDFIAALRVQREWGLLTNDALFIAVAERLRIQAIASADKTFAQVRGLILYSPDDLEA